MARDGIANLIQNLRNGNKFVRAGGELFSPLNDGIGINNSNSNALTGLAAVGEYLDGGGRSLMLRLRSRLRFDDIAPA